MSGFRDGSLREHGASRMDSAVRSVTVSFRSTVGALDLPSRQAIIPGFGRRQRWLQAIAFADSFRPCSSGHGAMGYCRSGIRLFDNRLRDSRTRRRPQRCRVCYRQFMPGKRSLEDFRAECHTDHAFVSFTELPIGLKWNAWRFGLAVYDGGYSICPDYENDEPLTFVRHNMVFAQRMRQLFKLTAS